MGNSSDTSSTTNQSTNTMMDSLTNYLSNTSKQYAANTSGVSQANYAQNNVSTTTPVEEAMRLIRQYTGSITSEQIQGYMSPYISDVASTTMALQRQNDAVQQQALKGNAISQNALGGDRAKIAQAELMRGQGLNNAAVIANLYNTGWGQALSAAQADRTANLQAAGMMGTTTSGQTAGTQNQASASSTAGAEIGQQMGQSSTHQTGVSNTTGASSSSASSDPSLFGWKLNFFADGGKAVRRENGGGIPDWARPPSMQSPQIIQMPTTQADSKKTMSTGDMIKMGDKARKYLDTMFSNSGSGPNSMAAAGDFAGAGDAGAASTGALGGDAGVTAADMGAMAGDTAASLGAGTEAAGTAGATASEAAGALGKGAAGAGEAGAGAAEGMSSLMGLLALLANGGAVRRRGMGGGMDMPPGFSMKPGVGQQWFDVPQMDPTSGIKGSDGFASGGAASAPQVSAPDVPMASVTTPNVTAPTLTAPSQQTPDWGSSGAPSSSIGKGSSGFGKGSTGAGGFGQGFTMARGGRVRQRAEGGWLDEDDELLGFPPAPEMYREHPTPEPLGYTEGNAGISSDIAPMTPAQARNAPTWAADELWRGRQMPAEREGMAFGEPAVGIGALEPGVATKSVDRSPGFESPSRARHANVPDDMTATPVTTFRVDPTAQPAPEGAANTMEPLAIGAQAQPAPEGAANVMEPAPGVSDNLIGFIKKKEGFRPTPYGDYKQTSIGYGTKAAPGDRRIDEAEADARLRKEIAPVDEWISSNVKAPITQGQRDALVSFGYNLGTGKGGLTDLLPRINAGDWEGVREKMSHYTHAGGKVLPDLIKRRAEEAAMMEPGWEAPDGYAKARPSGGIGALATKEAPLPQPRPATSQQVQAQSAPVQQEGNIITRLIDAGFNPLKMSDRDLTFIAQTALGGLGGIHKAAGVAQGTRSLDISAQQNALQMSLEAQKLQHQMSEPRVINETQDPATGMMRRQYGQYDQATQTWRPMAGAASAGAAAPLTMDTAPPEIANEAQRVLAGATPMPTPSRANPSATAVKRLVMATDPTYTGDRFTYRKAWDDPNKGIGMMVKAVDTWYGHADELSQLSDRLPAHRLNIANRASNWFATQTNDADLNKYKSVASQIVDEKIKIVTGKAPTISEREEELKRYDPSLGPDTIKKTLAQDMRIIGSREKAIRNDYVKKMGPYAEKPEVISSEHQDAYDRMQQLYGGRPSAAGDATAARPVGVSAVQLRQEAQAAIQRGADPDKVKQRMMEMGVQF